MSVHLQREIEKIKCSVLSLCAIVEDQVQMAVRALLERDEQMARAVAHRDAEIDQREVEIEENCLKILALIVVLYASFSESLLNVSRFLKEALPLYSLSTSPVSGLTFESP